MFRAACEGEAVSDLEYEQQAEPYWQQERVNERDEWDQHLRAVEDDERDRQTRDEGER